MSVDFSALTPPDMIQTLSYEEILSERKEALTARFDADAQANIRTILARESEPLTKFIEENAYRELLLRARINEAARACLLAYAKGRDLDHIAANFNMARLITSATTIDAPAVYESDEVFRARVQRAFDRLSVAGPEAAYRYHALSADGRVADVSVLSPSPAVVHLVVLQGDSQTGAASDELLTIVNKAVNAEEVRPIADRVSVLSAQIKSYAIKAKIYIGKEPEGATLLANVIKRTQNYAYNKKRLGRPVRLSAIHHCLHIDGVSRVQIIEPSADIEMSGYDASYCTGIDISIGGVE